MQIEGRDRGVAYTVSTEHNTFFIRRIDVLSGFDTYRYKTYFTVAWIVIYHKQVTVTFMDKEDKKQLFPMVYWEKVYPSWDRSLVFET